MSFGLYKQWLQRLEVKTWKRWLKDYLKGSELLWFLNYKTAVRTNFLLFENNCNLRFVRHRGGWEVFFDEKKITSAVPDNIFDIYVQKHFKTNHESTFQEDRPPSPKPLLQRRLKCERFLTGDSSITIRISWRAALSGRFASEFSFVFGVIFSIWELRTFQAMDN